MRNFARINSHYNKIAAWEDWRRLASQVQAAGYGDLVRKLEPPAGASYQVIDGQTAKLRAAFEKVQEG